MIAGSLNTHPGTDDRSITIRCPVEGLTPLVVLEDLMYRVTASESCFNIGCGMGLLRSTRMNTPAGDVTVAGWRRLRESRDGDRVERSRS